MFLAHEFIKGRGERIRASAMARDNSREMFSRFLWLDENDVWHSVDRYEDGNLQSLSQGVKRSSIFQKSSDVSIDVTRLLI